MSLWGITDSVWEPFENAYWLSKMPSIQALRTMPTAGPSREQAAQALAVAGAIIDVPIMVWGWPALQTMIIRENSGYTWVPNGMQPNVPTVPNADLPGLPAYDPNNPPPGSIKVSTNLADYPPYVTPAPVPAQPVLPIVGQFLFGNLYTYGPGVWSSGPGPKTWTVVNGQMITQDGSTYKALFVETLTGMALYFEKQ